MNANTPIWLCDLVIGLVRFAVVLAIVLPIGGLAATLTLLAMTRKSASATPAADAGFSEAAKASARSAPGNSPVAAHPLVGCTR